jgi:adenosylcobinamide-GDP ribazoletransferase
MKKEIQIFFNALMFYTRIPITKWMVHLEEYLNKSTKYLPLIGWIVGGLSALVFWSCTFILPISISIILSMIASILVTGAFHEDGLADVCDGFGGGLTKEKKLEIMKDSHIGTFGVTGLILVLGLKFISLSEIYIKVIPFAMIAAHSLSRFSTITIMRSLKYVRGEDSKIIYISKKISVQNLVFAGLFGIMPILLFQNIIYFILIIPVFFARWILGIYFKRQIGGYTGDCLGAAQQVCEVVFYLSLLILWKYI